MDREIRRSVFVFLGRDGRMTLPARVREKLKLEEGAHLFVDVDEERGVIQMQPAMSVPRYWPPDQTLSKQIRAAL